MFAELLVKQTIERSGFGNSCDQYSRYVVLGNVVPQFGEQIVPLSTHFINFAQYALQFSGTFLLALCVSRSIITPCLDTKSSTQAGIRYS